MKVVNYKVTDLKRAEYNPRQLKKEQYFQIKDSIERFGFAEPIVINTHKGREGVIIGGHQRFRIAKDLGFKEIPCVELDLELEREKELNVRLNKNTGEFDFDMLANHFDKEFLLDVGFKEAELGMFLDEFEEEFEKYDDSNAEMPVIPKFSEKYSCVIITSDNDIDTTYLETVLEIGKAQSYKNSHMGKAMVINVKDFQKLWASK
jgi:hypothetical protein|tara:strand:+ start:3353 stop:3967 length:615 start_codon:yes stop_codon:yes gene_type:complete